MLKAVFSIGKYLIKSIYVLVFTSIFILALSRNPKLVSADSINVNVTVPANINVTFNADGSNTISKFNVNNDSLVPIIIDSVEVTSKNNWNLVPNGTTLSKDSKKLSLALNNKYLSIGNNSLSINLAESTSTNLSIDIIRGAWSKPIEESAFGLTFDYKIGVKNFTLYFNSNGGSNVSSIVAKNGSEVILPNATREGYTFTGWKDSDGIIYSAGSKYTMPIGDSTLYAVWKANTYTVNYNANGGTGTTASSSHTYDVSKALTSNGFTRTGYTFLGWSTSSTATTATYTNGQSVRNLTTTNGGAVTLYAVWKVNSYKITFNANGGNVSTESKTVEYGSTFGELPIPTRSGYTFVGWYKYSYGGTEYTENSIMDASDITVYAKWNQKTATLVDGPTFNTALKSLLGSATKISFTDTAIPSSKVSSAKLVSTSSDTNKVYMYTDGTTVYVSPVEAGVGIITGTDCSLMFYGASNVTTLDLTNFKVNTSVTSMKRMFHGLSALKSLDLSEFTTKSVTDMAQMFQGCKSLTTLDLSKFNTAKVTDMGYMFYGCSSLTSLTLYDVRGTNFDTSKVTDMEYMFYGCSSLTSLNIGKFNTSNVTNMQSMFQMCSSLKTLNVSSFVTTRVTNMSGMFAECSSLTSLNLSNFGTSNVTNMYYMFSKCSSLTTLNLNSFNTSKVTNMSRMFQDCTKLTSSLLIRSNVTTYSSMFTNCSTDPGTKFTVSYFSGYESVASNLVSTKSSNSNVELSSQVYSLDDKVNDNEVTNSSASVISDEAIEEKIR